MLWAKFIVCFFSQNVRESMRKVLAILQQYVQLKLCVRVRGLNDGEQDGEMINEGSVWKEN